MLSPLQSADHITRRYMRGQCLTFAVALKRELDLPIYVLIDTIDDREDWHHAFVVDEDNELAIDIRGLIELDVLAVSDGMMKSGALSFKKASAKQIAAQFGHGEPSLKDINEARDIVRRRHAPAYNAYVDSLPSKVTM